MFCNNCGAQLPDGAAFCNKCGAKINSVQENNTQPVHNESQQSAPAQPSYRAPQPQYPAYGGTAPTSASKPLAIVAFLLMVVSLILMLATDTLQVHYKEYADKPLSEINYSDFVEGVCESENDELIAAMVVSAIGMVLGLCGAIDMLTSFIGGPYVKSGRAGVAAGFMFAFAICMAIAVFGIINGSYYDNSPCAMGFTASGWIALVAGVLGGILAMVAGSKGKQEELALYRAGNSRI